MADDVTARDVAEARRFAAGIPEGTPGRARMVGLMMDPRRDEPTVEAILRGDYDAQPPQGGADAAFVAGQLNTIATRVSALSEGQRKQADALGRVEGAVEDAITLLASVLEALCISGDLQALSLYPDGAQGRVKLTTGRIGGSRQRLDALNALAVRAAGKERAQ